MINEFFVNYNRKINYKTFIQKLIINEFYIQLLDYFIKYNNYEWFIYNFYKTKL